MEPIAKAQQEALSLNNKGESLRRQHKYAEAEQSFQKALALYQQVGQPGSLGKAICRDNLGTLYAETGRFAEALGEHWAALRVFEQSAGRQLDLAICANNLGMVFRLLKNHVAAEFYFEWALTLHERLQKPSLDFVGLLINLGVIKYYLDQQPLAESLLLRAAAMCDELGSDAASLRVMTDVTLSSIRGGEAALEVTSSTPDHELAEAVALALKQLAAGQPDAAVLTLQDPVGRFGLTSEPIDMVAFEEARAVLAAAYEATHRVGESARLLRANADSEMERIRVGAATAARRDLLDLLKANSPHFLNLLGHTVRHATDQELLDHVYSLWVQRRDIWLSTLATWARLEPSGSDRELTNLLVRRRQLMDQLAEDGFSTSDMVVVTPDEYTARYGRRLAERNEVADIERRITVSRQPLPQAQFSVGDVRTALQDGSLLIDVVGGCPSVNTFAAEADVHYAAFALYPVSGPSSRLVKLGSIAEVDTAVDALLRAGNGSGAARNAGSDNVTVADDEFDAARAELARLAVNLEPICASAHTLLLLLDGKLQFVPFDVLPWGEGADWMDRFQVSQVSTLRRLVSGSHRQVSSAGPPLVVAGPDFDFPRGPGHPYPPLPGAYEEGQEVASRLRVSLIAGRHATKSAVGATRSPLVLHVATHGFFASRARVHTILHESGVGLTSAEFADPEFERLARLGGSNPSAERMKSATLTDLEEDRGDLDTGLLNCGLAFASANVERATRRHAAPESSRNLTELFGAEIARMDLSGTELVVLTACEAGRGDAHFGSGAWGFPLAFTIAGARSVVFSVWKVDDNAALGLMKAFYDELLAGAAPAGALRSAKRALRGQGLHASRWAGFICVDGVRAIERSLLTGSEVGSD